MATYARYSVFHIIQRVNLAYIYAQLFSDIGNHSAERIKILVMEFAKAAAVKVVTLLEKDSCIVIGNKHVKARFLRNVEQADFISIFFPEQLKQ